MKALGVILIAGFALVQAGCASLDQGQCLNGDWSRIGYQDGSDGHPPSRLSDHAKACAAYGVRPDTSLYMAGRERGLDVYCRPHRGFEMGRMGRKYHGVCPPHLVGGFLAGYDDGLRVHEAEEHRDEIRRDVSRFDSQMNDVRKDMKAIAEQLRDGDLAAEDRKRLQRNRQQLSRDLDRLGNQRDNARHRERVASDHADRIRLDMTRYYQSSGGYR